MKNASFTFLLVLSNFVAMAFYLNDVSPQHASYFARTIIRVEIVVLFFFVFLSWLDQKPRTTAFRFIELILLLSFIPLFLVTYALAYGATIPTNGSWQHSDVWLSGEDRLYFSVVTFTTLGYGEITPGEGEKLLAASQAFLGFLFIPFIFLEASRLRS